MWSKCMTKMKPSWHGSSLLRPVYWCGRKCFPEEKGSARTHSSHRMKVFLLSPPLNLLCPAPSWLPRTSFCILPSETKLTHYRDSPARHRSCEGTYPVNQHTRLNYSCFKLSGGKKKYHPRTNTNCSLHFHMASKQIFSNWE